MKIENGYLVFDTETIKRFKKITGHSFVDICGFNPYAKKGDVVLDRLGLLPKQEIDIKYLRRGDFAEKIVLFVYERDGHNCTTYDKQKIKYDNFERIENFGGLIDIELLDEKTLIEVKSKSMQDYATIIEKQPEYEVMQGVFYGVLRDYSNITMEWVFFDEETEKEVFADKKPTTLKNLKRFSKTFTINDELKKFTIGKMSQALTYLKTCYETKKIPLDDVSDDTLKQLGLERPKFDSLFDTLGF